jgi:hypothetical protein
MSVYFVNIVRLPEEYVEKEPVVLVPMQVYFKIGEGVVASSLGDGAIPTSVKCTGEQSLKYFVQNFIKQSDEVIKDKGLEEIHKSFHEDTICSFKGTAARIVEVK